MHKMAIGNNIVGILCLDRTEIIQRIGSPVRIRNRNATVMSIYYATSQIYLCGIVQETSSSGWHGIIQMGRAVSVRLFLLPKISHYVEAKIPQL